MVINIEKDLNLKVEASECDEFATYTFTSDVYNFYTLVNIYKPSLDMGTPYILTSIRMINHNATNKDGPPTSIVNNLKRQTKNLHNKIKVLNSLKLSNVDFSKLFTAGRVFCIAGEEIDSKILWELTGQCINILQDTLNVKIVNQPDYDQMKYHDFLGGVLDNIDFQTKHTPSTIGTVTAFCEVLKLNSVNIKNSRWGIIGAGNLGSRIIERLHDKQVKEISVYDIDKSKLENLINFNIKAYQSIEEMLENKLDAIVFCANSGSLTSEIAFKCSEKPELIAVGGPEAALDRNEKNLDVLSKKKINFVPSLLCGVMGLVSNLEEIIGEEVMLDKQTEKLIEHIHIVTKNAKEKDISFHEEFVNYLKLIQ